MRYDPGRFHRRSIRLRGYGYTAPGAYFVTVCTYHKACFLGDVVDGEVRPSSSGGIVQEEWEQTARIRRNVALDAFIVMPNHVHAIIWLTNRRGMARHAPTVAPQFGKPVPDSLATIIGAFKSAASRRINVLRGTPGAPVWQRNYYEHVIRTEDDLNRIRQYIESNPAGWGTDEENPARGMARHAPS